MEIARLEKALGRRPKLLACELGSQGSSNGPSTGVEQLALAARDAGFDVVYEGLRATPDQALVSALEEGVHLIGLVVSAPGAGALEPVRELASRIREAGLGAVPVVVVGQVPEQAAQGLVALGVSAVCAPLDPALPALLSSLVAASEPGAGPRLDS